MCKRSRVRSRFHKKGALVLLMVLYRRRNYFISDRRVLYVLSFDDEIREVYE